MGTRRMLSTQLCCKVICATHNKFASRRPELGHSAPALDAANRERFASLVVCTSDSHADGRSSIPGCGLCVSTWYYLVTPGLSSPVT